MGSNVGMAETRCRKSSLSTPSNSPQVQCRDCGLERVDDGSLHLVSIVLLPSLYLIPFFPSFLDLIVLYLGQVKIISYKNNNNNNNNNNKGSFCGLANGPLTMTFSAFLVVIDIHRACCSEFAVTVMPAIYIDLASH